MGTITTKSIKSILAGIGGTLILSMFCTTFIALEKVLFFIPFFIAFNGAMTGFKLVEVMKTRIRNVSFYSFMMGIGGGAATFAIVNITGRLIDDPFNLGFTDMSIYIIISGVTSYLGTRLAIRYFNL